MNSFSKATKSFIAISLSTSLLVACSSKEETTNTTTKENTNQSQQQDQPKTVKKATLKEAENITNLGGEPVPELSYEEGKNSIDKRSNSVKNGHVFSMYIANGSVYVSIADVKTNKWITKNKEIYKTDKTGINSEHIDKTYGTGFVTTKGNVVIVNEKGEIKEIKEKIEPGQGYGFVRTSNGDAAYIASESSLKLMFENGEKQEIPMQTELQFIHPSDYIDLDKNIAIETGSGDFELFDLKKGKQIFDDNGQKLNVSQTGDYTIFKEHIVSIKSESNSNTFAYLDYKLNDKKLPAENFITVKGTGTFFPAKDKLVQIRNIEYEGKKSLQYIEYKEAK
ncbi:hypothetical protein bcgnr5378_04930 [Bacillus cereus]|uniref:Lipoprotein n=1 Tax=Bacillus cereus TaxID=1396 RepID=A0A164LEC4_BACCE|nr:hypothetical protein [Bacillus cereus]KZD55724.1 hypothetical protein B4088_5469 [Bacillus cereus]